MASTAVSQSISELRKEISRRRKTRHGSFFVLAATSLAIWRQISSAFFAVFIMVSAISAIVGGIVIMNVMLVSVTERRKEIGVRRAMGATRFDILEQFIAESVVQCIFGG